LIKIENSLVIKTAKRFVACGHRSLHPAQPNSTAQETQAFLRALELREPAALGERAPR